MPLNPDSIPSVLIKTTSAQWTCTACLRRSHPQLRKASTKAPPPPKDYAPQIFEQKLPEVKKHRLPTYYPEGKLSRAELDDLKRPPLPYLNHLIGSDQPPRAGQNPAKDRRSFSERVSQYWTREAHDERRRKINNELNRMYFQDTTRARRFSGKTWVAPDSPYQAGLAKYFPNIQGYTHADLWNYVDTTKMLLGKISVVCYVREVWSADQADSFVQEKQNPELAKLIDEDWGGVGLQRVWINYEEEWIKIFIMYCFYWWAKRQAGKDAAKSLVVTRGIDREFINSQLGITNLKVGHVFLVDAHCRIRWVGNGAAYDEEKASIVKVLKRLVRERQLALEKMKIPLVDKTAERKNNAPRPISAMMLK